MPIEGKATSTATRQTTQTHDSLAYSTVPKVGWKVSQVGFGGYRIDEEDEQHRVALELALRRGINLIDTSRNYSNGRSETLIGSVLTNLIDEGTLSREAVVLVSKVGYLQGDNYQLARQRKEEGRPFPNLVKYSTGLDHCIHPEFLEDQLKRTLSSLNVDTVDVYLLHNPEYYLSWAKVANIPREEAQAEYHRRIKLAFEYLEEAVERGLIQAYGVSSNTFVLPANDYTFTSLDQMHQIAQSIKSEHHFRMIQLPLNLFETGAITEANNGDGLSAIAYAHAHEIGVLVNRPLNAFFGNSLIRLADVLPPSYPASIEEVSTLVDSLRAEEGQLRDKWLPQLHLDEETAQQIREYLALGQMLEGKWQGFGTFQNWQDLQGRFFVPRAQSAIQFLSKMGEISAEMAEWLNRYIDLFNDTLAAVGAFYQERSGKEAERMRNTAVSIDAAWQSDFLSRTAVRAIRSSLGVTCTLVGMRQPRYVEDMVAELGAPVEKADRLTSWQQLYQQMGSTAPRAPE